MEHGVSDFEISSLFLIRTPRPGRATPDGVREGRQATGIGSATRRLPVYPSTPSLFYPTRNLELVTLTLIIDIRVPVHRVV